MGSGDRRGPLAYVAFLCCFALAAGIGLVSGSLVIASTVFAGLVLLLLGARASRTGGSAVGDACLFGGLLALVLCALRTGLAGPWLWIGVAAVACIAFLWASVWSSRRRRVALGNAYASLGLLLLCMTFGLFFGAVMGSLGDRRPFPSAVALPAWELKAGTDAVRSLLGIQSRWVLFYGAILLTSGWVWTRKRYGPILAYALFLSAGGAVGGARPALVPVLVGALSASPSAGVEGFLGHVRTTTGLVAHGIGLLALGTILFLLPAYRLVFGGGQDVPGRGRMLGIDRTPASQRRWSASGVASLVAPVLIRVVTTTLVASTWMSLLHLRQVYGPLPHFDLPDLAVPHLRPVWKGAYVGLAVLWVGAKMAVWFIQRERGAPVPWLRHPVLSGLALLALGVIMPAGVILLLFFLSLGWMVACVLDVVQDDAGGRGRSGEPVPAPKRIDRGPSPPVVVRAAPSAVRRSVAAPPGEGDLPVSVLFVHGRPLVSVVVLGNGDHVALDQTGTLLVPHGRSSRVVEECLLGETGALFALEGNRVLATGFSGVVVIGVIRAGALEDRREIDHPKGIRCAALNHFGTSLACAHATDDGLSAIFLEKGNLQELEPCNGRIGALSFVQRSRHLAAGTATGEVHLFDMSRRRWTRTLAPEPSTAGGVDAILPARDGGLIVLHGKRTMVYRGPDGSILHEHSFPNLIASIDHDLGSGWTAFGDQHGSVGALGLGLNLALGPLPRHDGQVTCVRFIAGGSAFLSAGRDGRVHRIHL